MSSPPRVRILTHYFPPEVGAPQARLAALAGGLAARGMDVTVHTGFPHYPDGRIAPPYRNRPLARETAAGGVRIRRSAVWPAANRGFAGRLADHLAFAGSALATAGSGGPADVVVAESPPLFLAAAAVGYARAKRAALVLHIADLWPESAVELGALRDRRAIAVAAALARFAYRHAALVVVPTEGMAATLAATRRAGAPDRAGGRRRALRSAGAVRAAGSAAAALRGHDRARAGARYARRGSQAGRARADQRDDRGRRRGGGRGARRRARRWHTCGCSAS